MSESVIWFAFVCLAMYIGDVISNKTAGKVPQMLIVAIIFLIGYWTFVPKNVLVISNVQAIANVMISMILIHVGTMFSVKSIKSEYKVAIITLACVAGICISMMSIGTLIFGKIVGFSAAAPMTGGGMAAMIVDQAATKANLPEIGMFAMMIFILHGFYGFPLTAWVLNKECNRLLADYRNGIISPLSTKKEEDGEAKPAIIDKIPAKYKTPTYYLTTLAVWAVVCNIIFAYTGINAAIVQVVVGIILGHFGLIDKAPMNKADSANILTLALFASFMNSFQFATPAILGKLAIQIFTLMTIATIVIAACSIPLGRLFGYSKWLSMAVGLNCFLGFPFNYALTNEAVNGSAKNDDEKNYLLEIIMPKMIIAGIIAVSIVSAVVAGIIVGIIF